MVFDAHFSLLGLSGYAIKSSLSDISESTNSFVSPLTFNGSGGEEDSPTSTTAKGSSWNWTLLSMKA